MFRRTRKYSSDREALISELRSIWIIEKPHCESRPKKSCSPGDVWQPLGVQRNVRFLEMICRTGRLAAHPNQTRASAALKFLCEIQAICRQISSSARLEEAISKALICMKKCFLTNEFQESPLTSSVRVASSFIWTL